MTGMQLLTRSVGPDGATTVLFGTNPWLGDLAYVLLLACIVMASHLTYRFVETPGRQWFRRLSAR